MRKHIMFLVFIGWGSVCGMVKKNMIEKVPDEVLAHVFEYVSFEDLWERVQYVEKRLNVLFYSYLLSRKRRKMNFVLLLYPMTVHSDGSNLSRTLSSIDPGGSASSMESESISVLLRKAFKNISDYFQIGFNLEAIRKNLGTSCKKETFFSKFEFIKQIVERKGVCVVSCDHQREKKEEERLEQEHRLGWDRVTDGKFVTYLAIYNKIDVNARRLSVEVSQWSSDRMECYLNENFPAKSGVTRSYMCLPVILGGVFLCLLARHFA